MHFNTTRARSGTDSAETVVALLSRLSAADVDTAVSQLMSVSAGDPVLLAQHRGLLGTHPAGEYGGKGN